MVIKKKYGFSILLVIVLVAVIFFVSQQFTQRSLGSEPISASEVGPNEAVATFAGGCFWCMEPPFEKLYGVKDAISGYTGGTEENPSYNDVASGNTSHTESVQVIYNPSSISYKQLLEVYWRQIDPTDPNGQFVDEGVQYRPEIFVHNEEQRKVAEASKKELIKSERFDQEIVVPITDASTYYVAEYYHQDYYKKRPNRYEYYRKNSGRDQFLTKYWGEDLETSIPTKEKIAEESPYNIDCSQW